MVKIISSLLSSLTSPVITRSKLFILIYGLYIFTCLFFYSVRFRPRIIYCVGIYPIVCIPPILHSILPKIYIRPYGSDIQRDKVLNYGLRLSSVLNMVYAKNARFFKYISISDAVTSELEELSVPKSSILQSVNSIDFSRFPKFPSFQEKYKSKQVYLNEEDIPSNSLIFLTVSNNFPKKNLNSLYSAIQVLNKTLKTSELPHLHFILLGENLSNNFRSYSSDRVSVSVHSTSYDESENNLFLNKCLCVSDFFLFPTLHETFGRVLVEAMLFRSLPICKKTLGLSSILPDDYKYFTDVDSESLSEFVKKIATNYAHDSESMMEICEHLYALAKQYSADIVIPEHIRFMEEDTLE